MPEKGSIRISYFQVTLGEASTLGPLIFVSQFSFVGLAAALHMLDCA